MQLATDFLSDDHVQISVGRVGSTHRNITQRVVYVEEGDKKETLSEMLLSSPPTRTLIFANHKTTIDSLDEFLWSLSFPCTSVHSDRTQREREDALRSFKSGRCPIMLATNVASRGLDIKNIMHIINYDLPQDIDEYVHRIGKIHIPLLPTELVGVLTMDRPDRKNREPWVSDELFQRYKL